MFSKRTVDHHHKPPRKSITALPCPTYTVARFYDVPLYRRKRFVYSFKIFFLASEGFVIDRTWRHGI